ncbi:hypothetical protein [Bacteroides faecis]|uniref:hypothetical protein n=1 Tax=Bacteroides faecis TaxID=674529 RepID=UPI0021662383|nr:hypothetical protein [Bacteroides faecis]MCS2914013.1 hypothetical protein [Bacteroides faecis]
MKENINYKLLYSIATRYYHTNNLEAAKILYEELVSNNIIPEFEFDVDLWNEIGGYSMELGCSLKIPCGINVMLKKKNLYKSCQGYMLGL